jgi:hypothetical protein
VKTLLTALILTVIFVSMAFALPMPGKPQIEYGCGVAKIVWVSPDSGLYIPSGYNIYKSVGNEFNWQPLNQAPLVSTTYFDYDLVFANQFRYGISAIYSNGESDINQGLPEYLPDPSNVDYLLIGKESEQPLNDWYMSILDSLGLHGAQVSDVLPYCGDALQNLRLLWIGGQGNDGYGQNYMEQGRAIINYLNSGGRLYVDQGLDIMGYDSLAYPYLGYGYTLCMPYPFTSMHGVDGTFAEGLWYQTSDTFYSSNMMPMDYSGQQVYMVISDDIRCGCVDLAVDKPNFKAVVNSQPMDRILDNENTGTRLEYFRKMLQFFDILSGIEDHDINNLPENISLMAYPNPFNAEITLAVSGFKSAGEINIFDITGRLVRTIPQIDNTLSVIWDGKNDQGASVTSGVYFAKVISGNKNACIKVTLLK